MTEFFCSIKSPFLNWNQMIHFKLRQILTEKKNLHCAVVPVWPLVSATIISFDAPDLMIPFELSFQWPFSWHKHSFFPFKLLTIIKIRSSCCLFTNFLSQFWIFPANNQLPATCALQFTTVYGNKCLFTFSLYKVLVIWKSVV